MATDTIERSLVEGKKKIGNLRTKIIVWLVIIALVAVAVLITFARISAKEYSKAEDKFQAQISELNNTVSALQERTAVYETASTEIDISLIDSQIKEIGELATAEYLYTDAGKFSDPKRIENFNIPLTTKSFIAKWDGSITAGIEVSEITTSVDKAKKTITVTLPKAKITHHSINQESFETLDENNNIFNPIKVDDVNLFLEDCKTAMTKRAIENGLLDKAQNNAQMIIKDLLSSMPGIKDEYEIIFLLK